MRALAIILLVGCAHGPDDLEGDVVTGPSGGKADTCGGVEDSKWAKCFIATEPTIYEKARATLRLRMGGGYCTGFLVGDQGHFLTNHHCVSTDSTASNMVIEAMAEGESCDANCATTGACRGTMLAMSAAIVKTSADLDYTLLKLSAAPPQELGYLSLRRDGASIGERIYIPQHPLGWGKRIAAVDGATFPTIHDRVPHGDPACPGSAPDVLYNADTNPGASGSPVIAYSDHAVVALHHCAGCGMGGFNKGIPIELVIADLGDLLPDTAFKVPEAP